MEGRGKREEGRAAAVPLSAREVLDRAMSETEFQEQVVQYARLNGWLVYHTYDSRRSAQGFPDLVLARGPYLIFAELKSERGRLTDEQAEWVAALRRTGQVAYVWRPRQWDDIEAVLV
jgi:hypothetical protein